MNSDIVNPIPPSMPAPTICRQPTPSGRAATPLRTASQVKTLMPSRDFSDVRDVARGYWSALTSGQAGQVYNLCSGRATTVAELIQLTLSLTALKNVEIVEGGPPPGPQDTLAQVGDASRLKACSGWEPSFSLAASLSDLLAEYRAEIRATQKRQSA